MDRLFCIKIKYARPLFFVFLFFFAALLAYSQSNPLEKRATLQVQNVPLEQVLDAITKQTGVRFSYNSQLINPKTKVTINAQNKTIKEILPKIVPSSISFKKVGEHIIFYMDNGKRNDTCLYSVSVAEDTTNIVKDTLSLTKEEEMKAQIAGLMLAVATASAPVAAQDTQKTDLVQNVKIQEDGVKGIEKIKEVEKIQEVEEIKCKAAQLTFFYPVGTGWVKSIEKCYYLSVNILGGVTGQTKGFEAGGLFNINKYGAKGAQFAGIFNLTAACNPEIHSANAQFAGIFNHTQKGRSVQFAGIFNNGDVAYFQVGGILNIAKESGAQFAGIFNYGDTAYFQAAGIMNSAKKAICQMAGIANIAKESVCQMAGIANVAQKSVCQIAGIVNVTKEGRFQMGLINVRDTADGVSLGLINIVKKGGILEAGIETGEFVHTALTFRSGVQRLYSILSVGYNYTEHFWVVSGGLGTSFKLVKNLNLNLELTHAGFNTRILDWASHTKFSPVLNYRFAKHFKIYAGPSLNLFIQSDWVKDSKPPRLIKVPYSFYHWNLGNKRTLDMWIGIVGGIKF